MVNFFSFFPLRKSVSVIFKSLSKNADSCKRSLKISKLKVVVDLNISESGLNVTLVPVFCFSSFY